MRKSSILLMLLMMFGLALSMGAQTKAKAVIPVNQTDPTSGKEMFANYCAPCHGLDGRGHGPVVAAMKAQPIDLTGLAKAHNGKFPDAHVASVLQFGSTLPAHGSADMPVWGPILGNMNRANAQERSLRIANLTEYIRSIQTK